MNRRKKIQATSSIAATVKLTTREVVKVVVVAAAAVAAFALTRQQFFEGYDDKETHDPGVDILTLTRSFKIE